MNTQTIEYTSLSDTNERETMRPTPGTIELVSLAAYMAEHMCPVQRATRATLHTPACPPSGVGSAHATIRCAR